MDQVEVEILCQVITTQHGTLNAGAILRTDAKFAKHLVDECGAAKYSKAKAAPKVSIAPLMPAASAPAKPGKKKEKATQGPENAARPVAGATGPAVEDAGAVGAAAEPPAGADVCTDPPVGAESEQPE